MDILFWILVGGVITFIAWKSVEMFRKSETTATNGGGGAGSGTGPDTAGELPKDNIK